MDVVTAGTEMVDPEGLLSGVSGAATETENLFC